MARIKLILRPEHIALAKSLRIQELKPREYCLDGHLGEISDKISKLISNGKESVSSDDMEMFRKIMSIVSREFMKIKSAPTSNNVGIDTYSMYMGSDLYEDMARILGVYDQVIPESVESPLGVRFPDEIMNMLAEYDDFMVKNLISIEEIMHQFCDKGVKPGKYSCIDSVRIWSYDGEEDE